MRTISCFASTLDGRIASKAYPRDRIGTEADLEHLINVRNQADAILCGGETFRAWPNVRRGRKGNKIPVQCLMTKSFNLPTEAPVFQADPAVPILIFSPDAAPDEVKKRFPGHVQWIATGKDGAEQIPIIVKILEAEGNETLLVEGGGEIMDLFLQAKAMQELYLTLCPLLLSGNDNPRLVSGPGFPVKEAPRTEVLSSQWIGQELYLHLKINY